MQNCFFGHFLLGGLRIVDEILLANLVSLFVVAFTGWAFIDRSQSFITLSNRLARSLRIFTQQAMRTLLRHAPTGHYFQSLEKWTTTSTNAHDFGFMDRAMRFVTKTGLTDMELILSFDDPSQAHTSTFRALHSQN